MKIKLTQDDVQLLITAVNESQLPDSIKWSVRVGLDQMQNAIVEGDELLIISRKELFPTCI